MFTEIRQVRQEPGAGRRRWFEADGLDLVVWFDGAGEVAGFQLCFDMPAETRAATWRPGVGFAFSRVDSGDADPLRDETPVLEPAAAVPLPELARRFAVHAAGLEPPLRAFVAARLGGVADSAPR